MASLQTLRNRGGVIVAIVIGLALLAFVLGDLLTSGSTLFGNSQMTVGEINGNKISTLEYDSEINYLNRIQEISNGQQSYNEEQAQMVRNQAWELLVRRYAIEPFAESAGIVVNETEMTDLMAGSEVSPIVAQVFANPETGEFDKGYMAQFIYNMEQDQTNNLSMFWKYIQSEVRSAAIISKFANLMDKSAYVTKFEAQTIADINAPKYSVRFVADRYESIPDSTVKVSREAARKFYNNNKSMFWRSNTSRNIEYIAFEATPSDNDRQVAQDYIEQLASDFQSSADVAQFASLNSQSAFDTRYYKEGTIAGPLGTFAFTATTDQLYGPELVGDEYTLARVSDVRMIPDSVEFSHIALEPTASAKADSIATALKNGASMSKLAAEFSLDAQSAQNGGVVGTVDPQTMPAMFAGPLMKATKGEIVVVNTPGSIHVIKVNNTKGLSRKVQLATVKYTVEPSEQTRNAAYSEANRFASDATSSDKFKQLASEGSFIKRTANISANDRQVNSINGSRSLAQWAYNSKVGDVSKVFEFGDTFIIATLAYVGNEGAMPFEEVEHRVEDMVRRELKAEMISKKMAAASSVDQLSSELSLPVIADSSLTFQSFMAPEIGFDPAFAGGVSGAKANLTKPIVGRIGVYVAQIENKTTEPSDATLERVRLEAEAQQYAFPKAYQELLEMSNIKDERYKFY